ncbi:MAG TPA: CDP-alcohol phosphatidyltransferase family protein [Actinomycetota bacterium]|nr:CDP-alcohol phosphatidyltransferase family protein [Actinomycetota bacterium]
MINALLRQWWDRFIRPVGGGLARLGLTANQITYLGVAIQIAVAVFIVQGRLLVAGLAGIVAGVADFLDGAVAKARGTASKYGAFLDSTTDRLSDALYFVPLAWLYGVAPDIAERDEPWVAAVALGALVFSFLVSYAKARAESLGYECNVGIAERAERLIVILLALLLDFVPAALVLLLLLAVVTFMQRMVHVQKQARAS